MQTNLWIPSRPKSQLILFLRNDNFRQFVSCLFYHTHCSKLFYQGCQKQPKENFPYSFGRSWRFLLREFAAIERAIITDSSRTFLRPCQELTNFTSEGLSHCRTPAEPSLALLLLHFLPLLLPIGYFPSSLFTTTSPPSLL